MVNLECCLEGSDRFVQFPLLSQRNAQIVVSIGIVRIDFEDPAKNAFCLGKIASFSSRNALLI